MRARGEDRTMAWVLYGAYGYTGRLILQEALRQGIPPLLAGRNPRALQALAQETGLPYQTAPLEDPEALDRLLRGRRLVLHAAGPFEITMPPMLAACLRQGVHYLDITGEIAVFEHLAQRHENARRRGVLLLPGVGLDVVPSDCLAAHLKAHLPSATHLRLVICSTRAGVSRGTLRTMVLNLHRPSAVRRDGRIVDIPPGDTVLEMVLGGRPRRVYRVRWGDVSTAYHTTGIPNIEVFMCLPRPLARLLPWWPWVKALVRFPAVRRLLAAGVRWLLPPGPSEAQRARGRVFFEGHAWDPEGRRVCARLETPEGYTLTARAAVAAVKEVLTRAEEVSGFQTPARLFGPSWVLSLEGVVGFSPCATDFPV